MTLRMLKLGDTAHDVRNTACNHCGRDENDAPLAESGLQAERRGAKDAVAIAALGGLATFAFP